LPHTPHSSNFAKLRACWSRRSRSSRTTHRGGCGEFWQQQIRTLEAFETAGSPAEREANVEKALSSLSDSEHSAAKRNGSVYALMAQLGQWDQIAPLADEIIVSARTPDAVRMASYALYNTGNFSGCLSVLDAAPAYFPNQEVPADLRRLRALAERAVGALPDAIRTERDLFDDAPAKEAFLELARLYFFRATSRVWPFTRGDMSRSQISRVQTTWHSRSTSRAEDQPLASALWRVALKAGIDDDHVGTAFRNRQQLGSGRRAEAARGANCRTGTRRQRCIQAVRFDELREWAIQRRQHVEQIWQLLRHGQVPNHIALGVARR